MRKLLLEKIITTQRMLIWPYMLVNVWQLNLVFSLSFDLPIFPVKPFKNNLVHPQKSIFYTLLNLIIVNNYYLFNIIITLI